MAVVIRLARYGKRNRPFYRVVVADQRFPRDGRFLEHVGYYDPKKGTAGVVLNRESVSAWVRKGAQMTDTVRRLVRKSAKVAVSG